MSLCSNTLRAHLRPAPHPKTQTLLPFLYQTATIQQWHAQSRLHARRYVSYRTEHEDSIPFEDAEGNLPPRLEDVPTPRKTTMTTTERAAFEKLYKTFNTQGEGRSKSSNGEHEELDQIADEYYEDDEEPAGHSLHTAFDAVLKGSLNTPKPPGNAPESTPVVAPAVPDLAVPETPRTRKLKEARAERDRVKKAQLEQRERVKVMMKTATSDRDLWHMLERAVLDPIRKLDLDGTGTEGQSAGIKAVRRKARTDSGNKSATNEKMLFANYPSHLLTALLTLRHHFPTSQYPLMLIPTIKSLGRSSYALGASTVLYKHLLRTAWLQQSSYTLIDTLLTDMDTNAIEFDAGILEVLDAVIKEHNMARTGKLGMNIKLVYGMQQWLEGIQKIKDWRKTIALRLGIHTDEEKRQVRRRPNLEMFDAPQMRERESSQMANATSQAVQEDNTPSTETLRHDENSPLMRDDALDILDEIMGSDTLIPQSESQSESAHDIEDDPNQVKKATNKVIL